MGGDLSPLWAQVPFLVIRLLVLVVPALIINGRAGRARSMMWGGVGVLVAAALGSFLLQAVFYGSSGPVSQRALWLTAGNVLGTVLGAIGTVLLVVAVGFGRQPAAPPWPVAPVTPGMPQQPPQGWTPPPPAAPAQPWQEPRPPQS